MYLDKYASPKWDKYFAELSHVVKIRILKKIKQILINPLKRHLKHGLPFFVEEIGQYRVVYKIDDSEKVVKFYFVGDHKEYEKWYLSKM